MESKRVFIPVGGKEFVSGILALPEKYDDKRGEGKNARCPLLPDQNSHALFRWHEGPVLRYSEVERGIRQTGLLPGSGNHRRW